MESRRFVKKSTLREKEKDPVTSPAKEHEWNHDICRRVPVTKQSVLQFFQHHTYEFIKLFTHFENPQVLVGRGNLQYCPDAQRLRDGVYILMKGCVRVLVHDQRRAASKMEIDHTLKKLGSRAGRKGVNAKSKFMILEAELPFQVIECLNCNCLALSQTLVWYIEEEELVRQKYHSKQKQLKELLLRNQGYFYNSSLVPFTFSEKILPFRNIITLEQTVQIAIVKSGNVSVHCCKTNRQFILNQGNLLIKRNDLIYKCLSSQVRIIQIITNSTFQLHNLPPWTTDQSQKHSKAPQKELVTRRILPKDNNKGFSAFLKLKSKSMGLVFRSQTQSRASVRMIEPQRASSLSKASVRQGNSQKIDWQKMRSLDKYQIASTTWSQKQYLLIQKFRKRYQKISSECSLLRDEIFLQKKKIRSKIQFHNKDSSRRNSLVL